MYLVTPRPTPAPRLTLSTRAAIAGLIVLLLHLTGLYALDWLLGQALPTSSPVPITSSEVSVVVEVEAEATKTP